MATQNVFIAARRTTGVRITLCAASTSTFACTSYPVFSSGTTDGTVAYAANSPLKQLSPAGSYVAANSPAVTYATSGTGLITFTYGTTFQPSTQEHVQNATPRRYKYILHLASHTPATAWSASVTASTAVLVSGTVNVSVPATQVTSAISVCLTEVV
jgi:hypothetical protein